MELLVDNSFLKEFSRAISKMKFLSHLDIEFRENQNEPQDLLFENVLSLENVKLKVSDLGKYTNLFKNKNISELTIQQYKQFINFENILLQFKVQKLITKQRAIINRLTKHISYNKEEFTKIIVLEEEGSALFQLCECTIIDYSRKNAYFQDQRFLFLHSLVFQKHLNSQLLYGKQQTLYDLFEM